MQALINNNPDNYYWVYKDGNLESTNCKNRKYRIMKNYRKHYENEPEIKNHQKMVDLR